MICAFGENPLLPISHHTSQCHSLHPTSRFYRAISHKSNGPSFRSQLTPQQPRQRRLARGVQPHQTHAAPCAELQIHTLQDRVVVVEAYGLRGDQDLFLLGESWPWPKTVQKHPQTSWNILKLLNHVMALIHSYRVTYFQHRMPKTHQPFIKL